MKAKYISYQDTHAFSKLVLDYVNDEPSLKDLYNYRPDIDGFRKAVNNHNFKGDRKLLSDVLSEQYAGIDIHHAVRSNILRLRDGDTLTVTTGHQLNLFTGPLYFIYKIVTTINLAIDLNITFPGKNFVPVYWMATEDHDFNEINHVKVDGKQISWIEQTNGATGRIDTTNVAAAVTAYLGYLGISKNGKKLGRLVQKAYLEHSNLADATRYLVNTLFEQYGLVIINADDTRLKKIFAPIMQEDILHQHSARNIQETNKLLEDQNYPIQVHSREINFFYLKDTLRERIIATDHGYEVNNTDISFTKDAMANEIDEHPERFSPNVVMRPLYEELILPNIAYTGGGAEVSYWLQLKKNFDHYGVDFPILLLRNSALVVDQRSAGDLEDLGFTYEDIFLPVNELQKKWVLRNTQSNLSIEKEEGEILKQFKKLAIQAAAVDGTLRASAESAAAKTKRLLDNLEKKIFRAEKRKHAEALIKIENLNKRLFPGGTLQERIVNLAPMYVNYGDDFISSLIENFDPLGGDFTLMLPGT